MSMQVRVLEALRSDARESFLVALGHGLGISARSIFAEPESSKSGRACNEMMIAIWSQLWAGKSREVDGYPDEEFLHILLAKADLGDARRHLRNALEESLRRD